MSMTLEYMAAFTSALIRSPVRSKGRKLAPTSTRTASGEPDANDLTIRTIRIYLTGGFNRLFLFFHGVVWFVMYSGIHSGLSRLLNCFEPKARNFKVDDEGTLGRCYPSA